MSASGHQSGISLIGDIVGSEIIIAHIAQQITQTSTFFVEVVDIELRTRGNGRTSASALKDAHRAWRETFVIDRINEIRLVHGDMILYLCLQGVMLLRNHFVRYIATEIAIITQDILSRLRTDAGIDTRYEYGVSSKMVEDPFAQALLALDERVVNPQTYGEWRAHR